MASKADLRKSWLKAHTAGEKKLAGVLVDYFAEQRKRIMAAAKELATLTAASAGELLDIEAEHAKLIAAVEPVIGELLATGAARVFKQRPAKAAKKKTTSKAFDVDLADFKLPDMMADAMEQQFNELIAAPYWQQIQQGTVGLVSDTLQYAIDEGLSIPNMRKLLQSEHANMSKWRATAIARTETTGALAAGHQVSYETLAADGERLRKSWLSIIDADTRPDHEAADGQTVDVDAMFLVGAESCKHPGDVSLSAKQRVNCRCSTAAEFD